MKIVLTSQALTPWYGGSAVSEASLAASLARHAHITVLCRRGNLDYAFVQKFGLKAVQEYRPKEVIEALRDRNHWLRQLVAEADVFHLNGHWKWENFFFAKLCRKLGVPYVLHPRGMLLLRHRKVLLKHLFNRVIGNHVIHGASRVIALSRFELEQWGSYRLPAARTVVIPNGIVDGKRGAREAKKGSPVDGPFFLYLGRLEARKNLVFLVDAFSLYVKRGGNALLCFVGPAERGYDRKVAERAKVLGLSDRVRLLPPVYDADKVDYLRHAAAVIYPSNDEPFGRVPFETLSAGGFPIVPDLSGSAEYLAKMLPECIYEAGDAQSLAQKLASAQKKTSGRPGRLASARKWIDSELDWHKISQRVLMLYEEILAERRPAAPRSRKRAGSARG